MNLEIIPGQLDIFALELPAWEIETGTATPSQMLAGSQLFDVLIDGEKVLTYGVEIQRLEKVIAWITIGVGRLNGVDLTAVVLPVIEHQLAEADVIAIRTMRPGLVRKLNKQGYSTSYSMTKGKQ